MAINTIDNVIKSLSNLDKRISKRIQQQVNRKILKNERIVEQARSEAPKLTGESAKNIKLRTKQGSAIVAVNNDAYALRFIERGTQVRRTESGANRGKVQRKPFLKPLYNKNKKNIFKNAYSNYEKLVIESLQRNIKNIRKKLG